MKKQKQHIQKVLKMKPSGFDPNVEIHREADEGLEYSPREKWQQQDHIDERQVLPNEIVIDIDTETTEQAREENRRVLTWLEGEGLPFYVADTGGTGFHIHIFFEVPENTKGVQVWKEYLYNWIKKEAEENLEVNTDLWDDGVNQSRKHLIRAVGGRKTDTALRKTVVMPTSLDKSEIEDKEEVKYPNIRPQDFWKISNFSGGDLDLTWSEIREEVEQLQEEKEQERKKQLESDFEAEDDGLEACRTVPAHEVFKAFFDMEASPGDMIHCPVHGSSGEGHEEGTITDGTEKGMPSGVYGCFGDSCTENGERIHWHNSIDILVEGLEMEFQEAKEALAEKFNIDLEEEEENSLSLEEKDEKIQEIISELQDMKKSTALQKKKKKDEIYSFLIDTPKSYRTEVFADIPGVKRDNKKGFDEYLANHSEQGENKDTLKDMYSKETINKAEKLLEEEHILKKVKTVLDHRIAGEDVNKLGLFLQLLSKDTEDPLMIFGIQKQGEGKSYIAKNVIELFPDHMVEKLTDATKSSIYRIAEDEGKEYFDGKIVFFGEIPENEDDREVFQIFRQLNSEGEVQKRLTLDREDGLESAKLELEGSPVVISTTVNEGLIDAQDMSRGMAYSPEMSKRQNEKVRSFQNRAHEFPEHLLDPEDIDELEEVIECALDILSRDKVKMQNPFTRDINNQVPDDSDNIKRDYPKTLKIAAEMPGYLYHRQRPKKEIAGNEYSFVTWEDVARGIVINRKFINNMIRGRTESTMDAYQVIKEKVEESGVSYDQMRTRTTDSDLDADSEYFTNKDLEKWMGLAGQTAREYTRTLDKMELVFKDSSTKPHRHYLVDTDKTETVGVTLRSLHNIIASVSERMELSEWARNYIEFNRLEGSVCEEDLIEMVAFTEDQLPTTLDTGLERDNSHTTPLYQQISEYKVDEATSLKVDKDGSIILYNAGSVSKSFSDNEGETSNEGLKKSEDDEHFRPQREIVKAFDELDAVGKTDGIKRKYRDIESKSGLDSADFEEVFERMENEGLIHEQKSGEYVLDKKLKPDNLVNV